MRNTHLQLAKLRKSNFDYEKFKKFEARIFKKKDYHEFFAVGAYLIRKAKKTEELLKENYANSRTDNIPHSHLRNIYLGLGSEYFFKAIYLKKGYTINTIKAFNKKGRFYTKKDELLEVKGNIRKLEKTETIPFSNIKKNLTILISPLKDTFDDKIDKENKLIIKKNSEQNKKYKFMKKYPLPKSCNFQGNINFLYGLRNLHAHVATVKSDFVGTWNMSFDFLDFVCERIFDEKI